MDYSISVVDDDPDFLKAPIGGLVISGLKNIGIFQDPSEPLIFENYLHQTAY